ncbi:MULTISPECIES: sensor histidine kinase [Paenibacillus]|uniref:Heme sensor protein HssS n=1 Tax=Paenibacillus validus TaxID=44253 RepID=A0A7X3CUK6_9BACL|nr:MULTISPECIES: ATP-binding protein [Paenibacillus]MUG72219.1 HAMP domain-containing protein [Paenibacillus validus]
MFKSLYAKVILLFLAIVVSILGLGYYVISTYLGNYLRDRVQEEMHRVAVSSIHLYNEMTDESFTLVLKGFFLPKSYFLNIYRFDGGQPVLVPMGSNATIDVDPSIVRAMFLNKQEYHGPAYPHYDPKDMSLTVLGVPFDHNGQPYAILLQQDFTNSVKFQINLTIVLLIFLLIGSVLLFFVSTKHLMKPLREMVRATRKVSKGDFEVKVAATRKDEVGMLAFHFNRMAGELKQIEQMRRDFVSNVSHEIQSPLTSIRGFSNALKNGLVQEEDRVRYYTIIHDESERLSRLCDNLLKLASLESDHHPFVLLTYPLDEQLRKVIIASEPLWARKEIDIRIQLEPAVITADQDQLFQVWKNLLDNSIKFTPQGGTVVVSLTRAGKQVRVSFMDSGPGIPADEIDKIFDRFYKADKSRNRKREGNGLGLAISKRIVDLHKGEIHAQNNETGAVFIVTVPVKP